MSKDRIRFDKATCEQFGIYAIVVEVPKVRFRMRVYVGSTINTFRRRWNDHARSLANRTHRNRLMQRHWDKYGPSAFHAIPLEILRDKTSALTREQAWFDLIKSRGVKVLNLGKFVEAPWRSRPMTAEHRRKIGDSRRGKKMPERSEEWRRNTSIARKGKFHHTEKSREKLRIAHTGKKLSDAHRKKIAVIAAAARKLQEKPYPALYNTKNGEYIPAGQCRAEAARMIGSSAGSFGVFIRGGRLSCKGWVIYSGQKGLFDGFAINGSI